MGTYLRVVVLACLALTASCASAGKQKSFAGEWSYGRDCDGGLYITLDLKQSGRDVTGEWSEGTNSRGDQGLFKGQIRNGTLVGVYCSSTGQDSTLCPEYDNTIEDRFTLKNGYLVRAQKYGSTYKQDVTLLPARMAKVERCRDEDQ